MGTITRRSALRSLGAVSATAFAHEAIGSIGAVGRAMGGIGSGGGTTGALPASLTVQNTSASPTSAAYITVGQIFQKGALQTSDPLSLVTGGVNHQVQVDALSLWPDNSIKFAALTFQAPAMSASGSTAYTFTKVQTGSTTALTSTFFLSSLSSLTVAMNVTSPVTFSGTTDIRAALATAFSGTPDIWMSGPLALQARADVAVTITGLSPQTFHIIGDVTVYADGTVKADHALANDLATVLAAGNAQGPINTNALVYTATVTLNGTPTTFTVKSVSNPGQGLVSYNPHYQYQKLRAIVGNTAYGMWNSPLFVQFDNSNLIKTGAVLPYDLTTTVTAATLSGYLTSAQSAGFDAPFSVVSIGASNPSSTTGLYLDMTTVGNQPGIGPQTCYGASWIISQDYRAAMLTLACGDTAGQIPWHINQGTPGNQKWFNSSDYPYAWSFGGDGTGGINSLANAIPQGSTSTYTGWVLSASHHPNVSYLPYLMTAARWNYDCMMAQAAWAVTVLWPVHRCINATYTYQGSGAYNDILCWCAAMEQREAAWSLRDVQQSAWIAKGGSWESTYFNGVVSDNYAWALDQAQTSGTAYLSAGSLTGFWFVILGGSGYYQPQTLADFSGSLSSSGVLTVTAVSSGTIVNYVQLVGTSIPAGVYITSQLSGTTGGVGTYQTTASAAVASESMSTTYGYQSTALWQQDFLTMIFSDGAIKGFANSAAIAQYQKSWLYNRIFGSGVVQHDCCAYEIVMCPYTGALTPAPTYYTTWGAMETVQQELGLSNGSGWTQSAGYYGMAYRCALGAACTALGVDSQLQSAFNWITASGAPYVDSADWSSGVPGNGLIAYNVVPTYI